MMMMMMMIRPGCDWRVDVVHLPLWRHRHRCCCSRCTLLLVQLMTLTMKLQTVMIGRCQQLTLVMAARACVVQMNGIRVRLVAVLVHRGPVRGHRMTSSGHRITQPQSFALCTYTKTKHPVFLSQ